EIIPFLDAPPGTAFERQGPAGPFQQVGGDLWEPDTSPTARVNPNWPPPGFPVVEGDCPITSGWSIQLPERFARRVEDGQLVLWRPGLTIWLTAWNNDHDESPRQRLAWLKKSASPERFADEESRAGNVTRYSYRLRDENEQGPVEALYGFVIGDDGHLQLAIYFDDPADGTTARQLVESVVVQKPKGAG
ncbi:MAG: DUF2185 domain-containing protein, partial [Planctomycetes bacterium]|nr:DUF2185 domain-containing protein [Planctomycetota bacterium]